jgi:hypothetical protein
VTVIVPFVFPEEGVRSFCLALGRPVVLHIVEKLGIPLNDGGIKISIFSPGLAIRPQTVDGERLAA